VTEKSSSLTYLGHRRRKDNHLVELTNPLHELVDAWSLDDIDIMVVALDFYGYCEVGLVKDLWQLVSRCQSQP
jgi:hypothetical protein